MSRPSGTTPQLVKRVDWLDALRGWAILGVVLVHSGQNIPALSGFWKALADAGQYGVQLFYVVSALTICLTYERQIGRGIGTLRASAAWLTKRFFRIAPLYYYGIALYLTVFTGMRMLGSRIAANSPFDVLANVLFIHSWVPSAQNTVVPGGWSIGVEMCFYLIAPILFSAVRSARASLLALFGTIIAVALLNRLVVVAMTGVSDVTNNSFLYFWFPTQLPVFMAGIALYRCAGSRLWAKAEAPVYVMAAGLAGAMIFGAIGLALGTAGDLDHGLAPAATGLAFCDVALGCRLWPVSLVLINQVAAWLGRISYSVYINHFAVLLALRFADKRFHILDNVPPPLALLTIVIAALALVLPASMLTRRLIEAPGIDIGHRLAVRLETRPQTGSAPVLVQPERVRDPADHRV